MHIRLPEEMQTLCPYSLSGGFPKLGVPFGGPHKKDYGILGSILGSPYLGKLPSQNNPQKSRVLRNGHLWISLGMKRSEGDLSGIFENGICMRFPVICFAICSGGREGGKEGGRGRRVP